MIFFQINKNQAYKAFVMAFNIDIQTVTKTVFLSVLIRVDVLPGAGSVDYKKQATRIKKCGSCVYPRSVHSLFPQKIITKCPIGWCYMYEGKLLLNEVSNVRV